MTMTTTELQHRKLLITSAAIFNFCLTDNFPRVTLDMLWCVSKINLTGIVRG